MESVNYYKALADETRLRLVYLLQRHELSVNEIVTVMGMGQSRVSRHLKILTDCGLLKSRRDGLWVFYSASADGRGGIFNDLFGRFAGDDADLAADYAGMKGVLDEGQREKTRFFDAIAPDWNQIRQDIFGGLDISHEIVGRMGTCEIAADLGCGTGDLLPVIRKKARRVIGVDKSPKMLEQAERRSALNGKGIELRIGEMEHLPMRDGEADTAVINMVLHHLPDPGAGIAEAGRVIRKGGTLILVDLDKHHNEEMRSRYEHRWLGFTRKNVERWLTENGMALADFAQFNVAGGLKVNLFAARK